MYSVKIDNNSYFTGMYAKVINGVNPIDDGIIVESIPSDIFNHTCYKLDKIDDVFVWNFDEEKLNKNQEEALLIDIRNKRQEAFKIIDFFQMVLIYNELSEEEKLDLTNLRLEWLHAPETKVIPEIYEWMLEKYKYQTN